MIRCTIELLPGGDEKRKRTIGLVEIANVGGNQQVGNYRVVLTKTPPFRGALKATWKSGELSDDSEVIIASVEGFHRVKRGSYDLLYRALAACGLAERNQ